jgi:hypothetical protein
MAAKKNKKTKLPALGRAVVVRWLDIATQQGWTDTDSRLGPAACISVGFVTTADTIAITLAGMHGVSDGDKSDHEANCRQAIPTGCVQSWAYLCEEPARVQLDVKPASQKESA